MSLNLKFTNFYLAFGKNRINHKLLKIFIDNISNNYKSINEQI